MDNIYHRQLGIVDPSKLKFRIVVIGAGSSGSYVAWVLAKMGCDDLVVVDFDTVEGHNTPNQLYGECDIGRPKVLALQDFILESAQAKIQVINDRWRPSLDLEFGKVVISCLDNMETRQLIWDEVKKRGTREKPIHLIDPRQAGENVVIYHAVYPGNTYRANMYDGAMHPSSESVQIPCTARAIAYNSMVTGALVGAMIKAIATDQMPPATMEVDLKNFRFFAK